MNRRQFIYQTGVTAAATAVAPTILFAKPKAEHRLTILHTNDWHSRIDTFPMDGGKFQGQGGAAMRDAMIKKIRAQEEHVLLLDAGDIFQGTPYFNFYHGDPEITLMNEMGYEASAIGNHDFDGGIDGLAHQAGRAKFPLICANYDFNQTPMQGKTVRYKVFEKGKLRVGVTGLGIEVKGLVPDKLYANTKYNDPVVAMNNAAFELKQKEKCDMVICLSHLGYEYKDDKISDVKLAAKSRNVDIVIGGHTHTFLSKPRIVDNLAHQPVTIVQAGWAGLLLGRLDTVCNTSNKHKRVNYSTDKVMK
jgi:5'-nucleotidase